MRALLGRMARRVPGLRSAIWESQTWVPPGHFYSPITSRGEIQNDEDRIFSRPGDIQGIDVNGAGQLALLDQLAKYYRDLPFPEHKTEGRRYYFENPAYSYSDAIFLYSMIRHLRPAKIIEIGSGYSSCAMLDVNETFFGSSIQCTFVDPYQETLSSLLDRATYEGLNIVPQRVQDLQVDLFRNLGPNDILFIDSTHVCKTGSDVNRMLFEILPVLAPGVHVHFHDVFYPFEYPRDWVYEGRSWNEAYLLRAFLQYNPEFSIAIWNDYLAQFHRDKLKELMPVCLRNTGASIWIKRL